MRRRRWIALATVALAVAGIGLGWLYTHPPLESSGITYRYDQQGRTVAYGIDLRNAGRWPLTLVAVTVDGQAVAYPEAMAVFASRGPMAGNAAILMEEFGHNLTIGLVQGWNIDPDRKRTTPAASYGVRLDWSGRTADRAEIVVHYRYLGLPMRHSVTDRWHLFE